MDAETAVGFLSARNELLSSMNVIERSIWYDRIMQPGLILQESRRQMISPSLQSFLLGVALSQTRVLSSLYYCCFARLPPENSTSSLTGVFWYYSRVKQKFLIVFHCPLPVIAASVLKNSFRVSSPSKTKCRRAVFVFIGKKSKRIYFSRVSSFYSPEKCPRAKSVSWLFV